MAGHLDLGPVAVVDVDPDRAATHVVAAASVGSSYPSNLLSSVDSIDACAASAIHARTVRSVLPETTTRDPGRNPGGFANSPAAKAHAFTDAQWRLASRICRPARLSHTLNSHPEVASKPLLEVTR